MGFGGGWAFLTGGPTVRNTTNGMMPEEEEGEKRVEINLPSLSPLQLDSGKVYAIDLSTL